MGARTNIQLKYEDGNDIYIYSHWGGGEDGSARRNLYKALARRVRWDDEMYLTAVIMREFSRDNLEEETGWGVSPYLCEEEYTTTVVDTTKMTVDGVKYADWLDQQRETLSE